MWNKDLKHMQEMSGESLGESLLALIFAALATLALWVVLVMLVV